MSNDKGFKDYFVDYTEGRADAPTMTVMVGVSGSGKSVLSREWVNRGGGNVVRFNRDNLRAMLFVDVPWKSRNEDVTRNYEKEGVKLALRMGRDVIVDDTNCVTRTRNDWEKIARDLRVKYRLVVMTTSLEECIERDSKRPGKECVGEAIVKKQYKDFTSGSVMPSEYSVTQMNRALLDREALRKGEFPLQFPDGDVVIYDMDGTLCNHKNDDGTLIRSPYDMLRVLDDQPFLAVVAMAKEDHRLGRNVLVVSGRDDFAGEDSACWLELFGVPFQYLLMRDEKGVPDTDIKQKILDELLRVLPKERIVKVVDDRPKVVKMWQKNGLTVVPVYEGVVVEKFTTKHRDGCRFEQRKDYRRCPDCGAMENF